MEFYDLVDPIWFLELREFLGELNGNGALTAVIFTSGFNRDSFTMEDSGKFPGPPVQEIEYLKLKLVALSSLNCEAPVDGLLWSCHPKNLVILITIL